MISMKGFGIKRGMKVCISWKVQSTGIFIIQKLQSISSMMNPQLHYTSLPRDTKLI